jgi:hypothetical protein
MIPFDGTSGTNVRGIGNDRFVISGTNIRDIGNSPHSQPIDFPGESGVAQPSNFFNLVFITYLTASPFPITRDRRHLSGLGSSRLSKPFASRGRDFKPALPRPSPAFLPNTSNGAPRAPMKRRRAGEERLGNKRGLRIERAAPNGRGCPGININASNVPAERSNGDRAEEVGGDSQRPSHHL